MAVGLGNYKSVACFDTITISRAKLLRLLQRHHPGLVVIGACARAGWVHDLCSELGLIRKVANTASEAWKFQHTKRKTDKDARLRLARMTVLCH